MVKSVGVTSTKKNLFIYIEACDAREKLTEVVRKCSKCFTVSAHKCNHLSSIQSSLKQRVQTGQIPVQRITSDNAHRFSL